MTLAQVDAAAAKVSERFGKTQGALFAVHGELRIDLPFKTDDALAGDGRDSRHLFSRTDGVHLFGSKGARGVYAAPDEATQRNVLSMEKEPASSDQAELSAILGRCEGVVRSTLSFFAFCVRMIDRIYEGCPLHSRDTSIKMVVDAAGFHSTKNRDQEIWKRLIADRLFAQEPPSSEKTEDVSLYTTGDGYYRIEDSESHKLTSYISNDSVPYLPEAVLATIAQNAPVAIMSATWNAPTVKNWNYAYLREIRGVMPADPEMDSLNSTIDRETRRLNSRIAGEYEVNARQIPAAGQIVRLAGCLGPTSIGSPDEAQATAREFLRGLCASESDVELCMSQLLGDAAFSIAASAEGGDASFYFRRISKYLQVAGIWGSSVADGRHYAGLALTMPLVSPTAKEPQNRLPAQLMTTIAVGWAKTGRGGFAGIDASADFIVFASSADWNDRWHTAKASLESGVPTLIVTPIANAGFSKNLQYRAPSCLDGLTTTLDYGYDMPPGIRPDVDFDCIFIENPTNRLQSTMEFDAPKWREGTLRGIIEQDELADRGEIALPAKKGNRQLLLSGNKKAKPKISDLESCCAEGGRIIAQAVGRIVRSRTKFLNVDILFDEEIAKSCDFGFLERGTNALELEALLDAIGETEEPCRPLVPTREEIAARRGVIANALERERHVTLVRRLMRDDPDEKAKDDFESHRMRTLRNFNPGQEDVEADRASQNYLVKAPWPVCGYAYATNGGAESVNAFDIEFPLPDEDTTDAALERIKGRHAKEPGARFDVVSLDRARFGQILAIPEVARDFEAQGYRTDYPGKAIYFYTPYAFISEFLGVLGEAAGYAILDAAFGDAYALDRGVAAQAERGGDFEVLARDGRRTRVWLDFKHYCMAAYLGQSSAEDEAAKFEHKADSVSAKALIVVNLLADDAAAELAPRPLVGGRVWSIPYLVHDGKVDDRSIMILKGLIDARADFE